jgi:hypothetical protein
LEAQYPLYACSLRYAAVGNANVMTESYGKIINDIRITDSQFLHNMSHLKEQVVQKLSHSMHPAVEAACTKHGWHQSLTANKAYSFFYISSEILGGYSKGSSYFRVTSLAIYRFLMGYGFEYIIQKYIYCNGFCNHIINPPAFVCR